VGAALYGGNAEAEVEFCDGARLGRNPGLDRAITEGCREVREARKTLVPADYHSALAALGEQ